MFTQNNTLNGVMHTVNEYCGAEVYEMFLPIFDDVTFEHDYYFWYCEDVGGLN